MRFVPPIDLPHFQLVRIPLPPNSFVFREANDNPGGINQLGVIISFDAPANPNGGPQDITNLWIYDGSVKPIKVPLAALTFPRSQTVAWWNNPGGDAGIAIDCTVTYNNPNAPPNQPYVSGDLYGGQYEGVWEFEVEMFVYNLLSPYDLEYSMAEPQQGYEDAGLDGSWIPATAFTVLRFIHGQ